LQLNQKMMMLAKRDAKKIGTAQSSKKPSLSGVSDNSILDFFLDKCIK